MELSVIIPVYQAETWLNQCFESVLACPCHEMEVIAVNDGSTDRSENLCRQWLAKDQRLKLVSQPNRGVSAARNAGILAAKGRYVMFLDADDWLEENWWQIIWPYFSVDYELVGFSHESWYKNGVEEMERYPGGKKITDRDEIIKILLATPLLHTCWGKLFLRERIIRNGIVFPEDMKIGEDYWFVLEYMRGVENACLINEPILHYRQTATGAMGSFQYEKRMNAIRIMYERCIAWGREANAPEETMKEMDVYYFRQLTKQMRDIAGEYNLEMSIRLYKRLFQEAIFKKIMGCVQIRGLGRAKRLEYSMMKNGFIPLCAIYFSGKSRLAKFGKR